MRAGLAAFWVLAAALEIYRRLSGGLPELLGVIGPWSVLVMTILPVVEAAREFRYHEPVEGTKSALWALLGIVTLLAGPQWLRFG
ncbi:MAG: hypothetical protein QN163_00585 [Armatimonadota bacterium]|nr:hypothetical protein [Armatimonadota bacterium]MDR5696728.1 hypothetical protein [Armatimonadota bacterium]